MNGASNLALSQASQVATFDALADTYDSVFTDSLVGKAQRMQVWAEMDRAFSAGQRILEINCGTGADAFHLTQRGVRVTACDSSPQMIAVARDRFTGASLPGSVRFHVLPTECVEELQCEGPFDGVLSNFSGLNCVQNLAPVARQLSCLLRPGAKVLLCIFAKFCVWEIAWQMAHGEFGKAFRRLRIAEASTSLGRIRYHTLREVNRCFAPHFRLLAWQGIGVTVPPSYLEPWARAFPRALRLASEVDSWVGRAPVVRSLGDHILLTFERCSS